MAVGGRLLFELLDVDINESGQVVTGLLLLAAVCIAVTVGMAQTLRLWRRHFGHRSTV